MNKHTKNISLSWEQRQKRLGNTYQSVLYKNLPSWLNASIHIRHTKFVLNHLPQSACYVLDVGCGYGRIANEIAKNQPHIQIDGVELCKPFADKFAANFGECFNGPIQEYKPTKMFDAIIVITVLMYANRDELQNIIAKLWKALNPNGRLICIEQSKNFLVKTRLLLGGKVLQPTGKEVLYFSGSELLTLLHSQKNSKLVTKKSFGLIPALNWPILHHGFILEKVMS